MKVLFFDIDGTLVDFDGVMADTTRKALDQAKTNGHKLFLCTGRNAVQIYPDLIAYGFDGIVSAAGACVSVGDEEIFHQFIDIEHLKVFVDHFKETGICYGVQSTSGVLVDDNSRKLMRQKFEDVGVGKEMVDTIMAGIIVDDNISACDSVEKAFYNNATETVAEVQKAIGDYFTVTQSSFSEPDDYSGEITINGVMKATGIQEVMKYYNIPREDTIAFGDGPNDLDMMEYAGVGVAMGNAREEVKAIADLVTDDIHSNGIYNAMKKLNLI